MAIAVDDEIAAIEDGMKMPAAVDVRRAASIPLCDVFIHRNGAYAAAVFHVMPTY